MQLLCLGDIALAENRPPKWELIPPGEISPNDKMRILFNWELPIGEALNPVPRSSGPRLLANPFSLGAIRQWAPGFASLATNHILDAGVEGLTETIADLNQAGFQTVGAGLSADEASKPLFWETSEGRLAIVNWVFPETFPEWMQVPGPNCWPELVKAQKQIRALKACADWVMVIAHWSDEDFSYPRLSEREVARGLIEAGADVIIGHHPHVVRGVELINDKPVFYSLGNFYFSEARDLNGEWIFRPAPRNKEALAVSLTFKHGLKPSFNTLSYWQSADQTKSDIFHRAVRRMNHTSLPLLKYSGDEYLHWYKTRRTLFDRWEYRMHFSLWKKGWMGMIRYPLTILNRSGK